MAETNGSQTLNGDKMAAGSFPSEDQRDIVIRSLMEKLTQNEQAMVLNWTFDFARSMNQLLDPRRDIDTECGYPDTGAVVDISIYKQLYDREPIANRVVSVLPHESWQVNPQIYEDESAEDVTEFEQAWDDLETSLINGSKWHQTDRGSTIWDYLMRMDKLAGLGHFGVMLLGIDDGKDLQEPVDGAVTIPEGYNPQGSISQTGSISSGVVWDEDLQGWVPRHGGGTTPSVFGGVHTDSAGYAPEDSPYVTPGITTEKKKGNQDQERGAAALHKSQPGNKNRAAQQKQADDESEVGRPGAYVQGTDQQYSTGKPYKGVKNRSQDRSIANQLREVLNAAPGVAPSPKPPGGAPSGGGKGQGGAAGGAGGGATPPNPEDEDKITQEAEDEGDDDDTPKERDRRPLRNSSQSLQRTFEKVGIFVREVRLRDVRREAGDSSFGIANNSASGKAEPLGGQIFFNILTREARWIAGSKDEPQNILTLAVNSLQSVPGVKRAVASLSFPQEAELGWTQVYPSPVRVVESQAVQNARALLYADSPPEDEVIEAVKNIGSRSVEYQGLNGKKLTRQLPPLNNHERAIVENWDKSKKAIKRTSDLILNAVHNPTENSRGILKFLWEKTHNKVTTATDARGRTVFAQPPGDTVVDGKRVRPNRGGGNNPQYDGSEYPYGEPADPNGDPYKDADITQFGSSAGYGLPSGVAMPAGALSGTDQQYFGIQFGPSETLVPGPLQGTRRRKLMFIRCFDESLVQIVRYEWNVNNPRFGMPVMYRVTLNDPREQHSGVGLPLATVFVHWSRVIHVRDNYQSTGTSEVFGVPRQRPVLNRLLDLRKIYSADGEGYWRASVAKLFFETIPQLGPDAKINLAALRDMMEQMNNGLQNWGALAGLQAKTLPLDLKDPTPHVTVQLEAIGIQIGCPVRILKGSERGEQASNQDDAKWNDRVKHRQHFFVTPNIIIPFVDRLIILGVLPEPKGYSVVWPDLDANTDKDKAGIALQVTQALAAYISGGLEAMMTPLDYLVEILGWEEERAKTALEDVKRAHEKADVMTAPAMVEGRPAEPAEGTEDAAEIDRQEQQAKDKTDALKEVAKQKGAFGQGPPGAAGQGSPQAGGKAQAGGGNFPVKKGGKPDQEPETVAETQGKMKK